MSQAHNPRDNQALLQSMLQRLKLQAGTTNIQSGQNTTEGQSIHSLTKVNNNPINGFEVTDDKKTEFTVNGKLLDLDRSSEDSGASCHCQEGGQGSQTGQCFLPKSVYAAVTPVSSKGSFNFSNSETNDISQSRSTEQKKDQDSGFVPKVYGWSIQNTETQNNKVSIEGVFGATGQNTKTATNHQNTTNRKQRSSENKTYKWTQKIKEKWRERPGSFGKKDRLGDKPTQENSPQQQLIHFNLPSIEESRGTPTLDDRTDHVQIQTSNGNDESMRSTSEFDLGLGSFSLLDEIVSGREWAKFLNPGISVSVQGAPSQETMNQNLNNYHVEKSEIKSVLNERNVGTNTNIYGKREASNRDIAMTQVSPDPPLHISMDITEKAQMQSEPMDHWQSQSDMQVTASVEQPQQQHATESMSAVDNSLLRSSRKRQHQSYESMQTKFQRIVINGNDPADDESVFLPNNHVMDSIDGRPTSFFPSTTKPCVPIPRGVLKSTLSMETVIKRRRVDVTRHVRFSEEIISIEPPELTPDMFESEEEEEEQEGQEEDEEDEEEDSLIEEGSEEHSEPVLLAPVRPKEVAPSRRPTLPAWIRAFKRNNLRKKHRK
ncbi:hypothetical protein NL108_005253 [Boleophthalmus pectinirostris]|uniref:uncharacterized protein zgc:113229 n=1 Tax=Boleophthalmus pectinirostris TaxID=150288 RepID=UPI00242B91B9|nr:uncharacterized protein zgc:113229 [Boleophthalmus pectinirostris]KAJ0049936.1 hypothetical protein NL108_005253 [Boleophthalmus pectinirostris]